VHHGATVAVVVPAFNEAAHIAETLASIAELVDHVLVVDDCSTDGTAGIARAFGGRVEVFRHADNRGVGASIATGYRRALDLGADVVAVMAGDGQMDPDDLESVLDPVVRGHADYAKGDRLGHPSVRWAMPRHRYWATRVLSWLTRRAAGLPALSDSQSGYTAISAAALLELDLDGLWPGYGYPNDLIGALAARGLSVCDVVVRPVYRGEKSGLRPWHLAIVTGLVGRVALRRLTASDRTPPSRPGAPGFPSEPRRSPARSPTHARAEPLAPP
jgi:glycosyltransferase involved in cell wall biosynthesis